MGTLHCFYIFSRIVCFHHLGIEFIICNTLVGKVAHQHCEHNDS